MRNAAAARGWFSSSRDGRFFARRNSEESGFTIIELVVSMALLAIVAAPLAGVFWSAIRTAGSAAHRTDGASIASREIEAMRAVPYQQVGFYGDQTGYTKTLPDGSTTVLLGDTSPSPGPGVQSPQIQPQSPDPNAKTGYAPDPYPPNANPIVMGGVTYKLVRNIVWADAKDPTKTYSQAYKKLSVIVTWSDQAGDHTVEQDSLLYPGGLGTYTGAGPDVTTTTAPIFAPSKPTLADIIPTGTSVDTNQATLNWTQPPGGGKVAWYQVAWSTDPSFPAGNITLSPNLTGLYTFPAPGLTPNTLYYFKVVAYASPSNSTPSDAKTFQTAPLSGPVCTLGGLNIAGDNVHSTTGTTLKSNGQMSENLILSWTTAGPCTDVYEVHGSDPSSAKDPGSPYPLGGSAGVYNGIVPSSNQKGWSVGVHTFNVFDVSTGKATAVVKTFKVCANGVSPC